MTRTILLVPAVFLSFVIGTCPSTAVAQVVVPGTGTMIDYVGDDFEQSEWSFIPQGAKSSREIDGQLRSPTGYSVNRRWNEGPERGYPDLLKVIETPADGLPGSEKALLMRTLRSGIPGRISNDVQQDDLIVNSISRLGTTIRVSEVPSVVVRVFLPSSEYWENRSGPQFGFRSSMSTTRQKQSRSGLFGSRTQTVSEPYWPGMWIHFRSETDRSVEADSAFIKVRGDKSGRDFKVLDIGQTGWWTLGMSFTPDGMVHYFASPGVDPLTRADHITSQYPYSFRAEQFRTFFFNVCNRNDGRSWSTPFVIDDPQLFIMKAARVESLVNRKKQAEERRKTAQKKSATTTKR